MASRFHGGILAAFSISLVLLLLPAEASAQCGYGTSSQDCYHQQRDAQSARDAEQHHRDNPPYGQEGEDDGDTGGGSGSDMPPPPSYGYVSVAWHRDSSDVWATWNRRTEDDAATSALAACRRAMGEGCFTALTSWNSTIAIAKARDGGLKLGWGAKEQEAVAKATDACNRYLSGCTVPYRFSAKPWMAAADHFPARPARVSHALVAWPTSRPAPQWTSKVWIATGQGGYEQSSNRAGWRWTCASATPA